MRYYLLAICLFAAGWFAAGDARAADVDVQLSTREAYVGEPIVLEITIQDTSNFKLPKLPLVDGLQIRSLGAPSRRSQTTIINGNVSQSESVTFRYAVTASRAGEFEIPAFEIIADGESLTSQPLRFVSGVSETGDLLFVEIAGKQDRVYVGEPLELTLKVWIRPFRDQEREITLDEETMWGSLSPRSSWGSFATRVQELAESRKRPGGQEVLREDTDGTKRSYYLYEIETTIYPKRPGEIDASDVRIIVDYPVELGQVRDPMSGFFRDSLFGDSPFGGSAFGSSLRITKTRPIEAEASVDATQVIPIPQQGRPAEFQGAVGNYKIATRTDTTVTHAGDPITLQIEIRGDGPLELVQAPPLEILDRDFRVDQQPLAGFVQDGAKYFTTTVRPRDTSVTEIPPIKMSFFNPETEAFETAQSQPIAIEVRASETLQIDSLDDKKQATLADAERSPKSGGFSPRRMLFASRSGAEVLASQSARSLVPAAIALLFLPPLAFIVAWSVANRSRFRSPSSWFRTPRGQALKDLRSVDSCDQIPDVLTAYLKTIGSTAVMTSQSDWLAGLGFLRARRQSELAAELETIAHQCKTIKKRDEMLVTWAMDWIERTDTARKSRWRTSTEINRRSVDESRSGRKIAGQAIVFLALSLVSPLAFGDDSILLSESQCSILLSEANTIFTEALSDHTGQSKEKFALAAEKYQRLVDSGIENGELYLNLGHAYYQSDQLGHAIANYRYAERYRPFCPTVQITTVLAQSRAGVPLSQWRLPLLWLTVLGIASMVGWGLLTLQIFCSQRTFWGIGIVVLLIAVTGAILLARETLTVAPRQAIALVSELTMRDGDGDAFDAIATLSGVEGRSFRVVGARSDWVNVVAEPSRAGWVRGSDVALVNND